MSFEPGTSIGQLSKLKDQGLNIKQVSKLISTTFNDLIFTHGFVHADPHPGNIHVRKGEKGEPQLILLDHGVYTELTEDVRLAYTKLWRGILTQNNELLKEASLALDVEYFELFTAMVTNRTYEDVVNPDDLLKTKKRLRGPQTAEEKQKIQEYTMEYQKDIAQILGEVNRTLLLVFKTNNYLRAIDNKLGTPLNTWQNLNTLTWKVFEKEIISKQK